MNSGGTYFIPEEKKSFITDIKNVKMNYKVNEPTVCGNIYKEDELRKVFDKALKRNYVPVVRNSFELYKHDNLDKDEQIKDYLTPVVSSKDIIGFFRGYEIKDNGDIYIKVKPIIDTELFDCFLICTGMLGTIRKDNSVDIQGLVGFFLAGDIDIIEPERYFGEPNGEVHKKENNE